MAEPIQTPPPDLSQSSLADIAAALADRRLPPVDSWNPAHCGDSEMRIAADGTWFHQGSPILRPALVRLFSTILRREADGSFVLVTPGEKLTIDIEDAPFTAVEMTSEGNGSDRRLAFRLNTDELVIAGPDHPIRVETGPDGAPRPYLHVRGDAGRSLDALIGRTVFYELAEIAVQEAGEAEKIGVWSDGGFFAFPV